MDKAYDKFDVEIKNVQLLFGRKGNKITQLLFTEKIEGCLPVNKYGFLNKEGKPKPVVNERIEYNMHVSSIKL